jgi:uncharacterized protein (DUF362 family)
MLGGSFASPGISDFADARNKPSRRAFFLAACQWAGEGEDIMHKPVVAVVRYEKPVESVRQAVAMSRGLDHLPEHAKVFIKPNIMFWTRETVWPKWGVITTSRVVEDAVILLKERGIDDITIGEGLVTFKAKDTETPAHAFETLGYNTLIKRYGVKVLDIHQGSFEKVDLGDRITLKFNTDYLASDFVVNIPVLKAHALTKVSLGIKNLKGLIDVPSRKKCHNEHPKRDLHYIVGKLAKRLPPSLTILDGIYTIERGPLFDGKPRRSDILVASSDVLAADVVGAQILGYDPSDIPHLVHAARDQGRSIDPAGLEVVGEKIEDVASYHEYTFPYNDDGTLPAPMEKMGIQGLSYRKYDLSLCTYCVPINGLTIWSIAKAWKGQPWDDVEILTGKTMKPTQGKKKTILLGKCIYQANKDHPDIQEMIAIKGCPPSPSATVRALRQAGIEVDSAQFEKMETYPGLFMRRYENRPEFEESFFTVA